MKIDMKVGMSGSAISEQDKFSQIRLAKAVRNFISVMNNSVEHSSADVEAVINLVDSATRTLMMEHYPHKNVAVKVGDIVQCDYGKNLPGEVSGRYTHALVCRIEEHGMLFLVPITKAECEPSMDYRRFFGGIHVTYTDPRFQYCDGGTLLLRKGGTVSRERVFNVVGYARLDWFMEVVERLNDLYTFDAYDYELRTSDVGVLYIPDEIRLDGLEIPGDDVEELAVDSVASANVG